MTQSAAIPKLSLLGLLLVVFGVYAPSLANGYAFDGTQIASPVLPNGAPNGMTAELRALTDYFSHGYWHGNGGELSLLFRPVTILSYAVTNALCDGAAFPHHLLNVLLKLWATWLAFAMLRRCVTSPLACLLGAATFGLHAIHSEVVAGIVGRAELFAFCFGAQGLLWTLRAQAGNRLAWPLAAMLFWLAFSSKESALAWVPFTWLFCLLTAEERTRATALRTTWQLAALFGLPVLAFFGLREIAVGHVPGSLPVHYLSNPLFHEDAGPRMLTGTMIWGFGLFKCLWPTHLISDYGPVVFELVQSPVDYRFLLAVLGLGVVFASTLVSLRRAPVLALGGACFLGFSLLTSNVPFAIGTIFGERLFFTPSLGLAFCVAHFAARAPDVRRVGWPLAAWSILCIWVILGRNGAWSDDDARIQADAATEPRLLKAQDALAQKASAAGNAGEAERIWRAVLERDPWFVNSVSNLATFLASNERFAEAEKLFLQSLQIPESRRPLHHITHYNLAALYELQQRPAKCLEHLRLAWQQPTAFDPVHEDLFSRSHAKLSVDEMAAIIDRGTKAKPDDPTWPLQRGYLALARKDQALARREFETAYRTRPWHPLSRYMYAVTLIQGNDAGEQARGKELMRELAEDPRAADWIRTAARRAK